MFVLGILIHIVLGLASKKVSEKNKKYPGNLEIEKQDKMLKICFKWWPAAYIVIILITLYTT